MSIESAKAFLERVRNDEDFRKELEGMSSVEERTKFVKAQGFDFTEKELDEVTADLGEDQLEGVSGGKATQLSLSGVQDKYLH